MPGKPTSKRSCPLCKETHCETILSLHYAMFDHSRLDPEFDMVTCSRCGFVFFDTSVTYEILNAYYSRHLFYDNSSHPTTTIGSDDPCMQRLDQTAALISKHVPDRSARIIDVGANQGEQLLALKLKGYTNLYGVDMRQACVQSMKRMGVDAHIGAGEALPPEIEDIDVCILSHTVEHMIEPVQVLNSIRSILTGQGMLYIEVPDAGSYPIQDVSQWHKFMFYEHLNHFDLTHLEAMAQMCGFKPIELGRKTISHRGAQINSDNQVTCIYGLFEKGEVRPADCKLDFETGNYLQGECEASWRDPGGKFESASCSENNVYLWGISQYAQLMLGSSPLFDCDHLHLVDRDPFKQRQTINGKPIVDPSILNTIGANSVVLLSDRQAAPAMQKYLNKKGSKGKTIILGVGTL